MPARLKGPYGTKRTGSVRETWDTLAPEHWQGKAGRKSPRQGGKDGIRRGCSVTKTCFLVSPRVTQAQSQVEEGKDGPCSLKHVTKRQGTDGASSKGAGGHSILSVLIDRPASQSFGLSPIGVTRVPLYPFETS